ncbi:WYL domain-containing protein [Holdemanella biformis]|uniref:WYL domain-containing protein n=1 Tax=Holdemanella biformis TaxID=1735 RepID=UPI0026712F24|nr:WYL domain-containing protein [Holdemanella biformis]
MATIKCPYCSSKIKLERFQYKDIIDSELNDKYVEEKQNPQNYYSGNDTTNIYVDEEMCKKLDQDAVEFGFVRSKNGNAHSPNRNAFISAIMTNYYDEFNVEEEQKKNVIVDTLKQNIPLLKDVSTNRIASCIMAGMDTLASEKIRNKKIIIKLKKTNMNENIYDDIQYYKFFNNSISSISEFYYSMFQSFFKLPQYLREQIIFKKKFKDLRKYIEEGKTIHMKYKKDKNYRNVFPYKIVQSVEESHNYLLCVEKTEDRNNPGNIITMCISYRIDNIGDTIKLSNSPFEITEIQKQALDESISNSPSSAQQEPGEHILVALNSTGVGLLDAIYTFKPTHIEPIKQIREYTIYKVYGSKFQSYTYFKRFGEHAIILNDNSFKQSQLISAQKIINNYNSISSQLEEEFNQ